MITIEFLPCKCHGSDDSRMISLFGTCVEIRVEFVHGWDDIDDAGQVA